MTREAYYAGARSAVRLARRCYREAEAGGDDALDMRLEALRHFIRASYYMRSRKAIGVRRNIERLAA